MMERYAFVGLVNLHGKSQGINYFAQKYIKYSYIEHIYLYL